METYLEEPKKNWFQRNWLWLIPTGCATLIVIFVLFIGGIIFGAVSMVKNSEPFEEALERAQRHEVVIEHLGEPLESDGLFDGNLSYSNGEKEANITVPVKGPKGKGKIKVIGSATDDTWSYEKMEIILLAEKDTINLLVNTYD